MTSAVVACKILRDNTAAEIKFKQKVWKVKKSREQQWAFSATKHIARIKGVEEVSLFVQKGRDETGVQTRKIS
jgi:hypothetical protein